MWLGRDDYKDMVDSLPAYAVELATLKAQLAAETTRRERAELDLARLNDDFRGLVALTAGRIPPKLAPQFEKDLWAEDTTQPVTFLSPDPDAEAVSGEEIIRALNESRSEEQF